MALRSGQSGARGTKAASTDHGKRRMETLKLDVVAALLIVAFATALIPSVLPSRIVQEIFSLVIAVFRVRDWGTSWSRVSPFALPPRGTH